MRGVKLPLKQYGTTLHDQERFVFNLLDGTTSDAKPLDLGSPKWDTMMEYAAYTVKAVNAHDKVVAGLKEAINQIEYLHGKFQATGTGNTFITKAQSILKEVGE